MKVNHEAELEKFAAEVVARRAKAAGPALLCPADGLFSAAEFAKQPVKPRPWLVADMIPLRQVSSVDGDGGTGKTTLALQLLAAVVTGRSWVGQTVARGPAIYLSAEDDKDEIHRRLASICVECGVRLEDLGDLHVWALADSDPALVVSGQGDALVKTDLWRKLEAAIIRIRPVTLVLDSRADVFGGNEISRAQARNFIALLRALAIRHDLAVILLAHPSVAGMASGTGNSGSTHWRNAVRSALYLTKPTDPENARPDARMLTVMKSNYGPGGLSLRLRWSAGAFVLDGGEGDAPLDREAAMAFVDQTFLHLLTAYTAQGRRVSDMTGANYAPAVFAKDPAARGATKVALSAAMNRLFSQGKIEVETVGPASRQRRQLVRSVVG